MNSLAAEPTVVKASVNWQVAVDLTPAELGRQDALNGFPCDPRAHFGNGNDYDQCHVKYMRGDYVLAYVRAKGR